MPPPARVTDGPPAPPGPAGWRPGVLREGEPTDVAGPWPEEEGVRSFAKSYEELLKAVTEEVGNLTG